MLQEKTCLVRNQIFHDEAEERPSIKRKIVDEFFSNNPGNKYDLSNLHALEQSHCYPIIYTDSGAGKTWYYCRLHSNIIGPDLSSIEFHCMVFRPAQNRNPEDLELTNGAGVDRKTKSDAMITWDIGMRPSQPGLVKSTMNWSN